MRNAVILHISQAKRQGEERPNVNLLDGTRNGKNSEGKEIWTKATNNRGNYYIWRQLVYFDKPTSSL